MGGHLDIASSTRTPTSLTIPPPPPTPFIFFPKQVLVSSSSLLLSEGYPPPQHEGLSMRQLPQRWEVRVLAVKQNWLLEYLPNETRAPVGFIHLEVRRAGRGTD
jgi:hypothetical protein